MTKHLTPFEVCQRLIGPVEAVSAAVGYERKAAYAWRHPSQNRDAGDIPTPRLIRRLLAFTRARGIPLTAEHLIWGASADEIDQLLAQPRMEAAE